MVKRITSLGVIKIARWLLATIGVCLVAELCAAQSSPALRAAWEPPLRQADVLREVPPRGLGLQRLLADAADGQLGSHRLIQAALIASGVDDAGTLHDYQRRFDNWYDDLKRSGAIRGDHAQRAKAIHDYLHRHVLRGGYRADATDLATVFETGEFNCVSSVVCFLALAQEFGTSAQAIELPGHCLVELPTAAGVVELETTCPQWFDVLDLPDRRQEMLRRVTGFEHRHEQRRRPINHVQLLGIIFYNRGVEQLHEGRYRESAESNLLAMQIDPTNKIAQGNLLATLNNWALDIQAEGRHAEALNLLDAAIKVAPQHQNFLSNEIHITQTWVETLLAAGHWRQALALVESTAARRPGEPYYRQARWSILERHAEDLLAAGRLDQVVDLFDQVRDLYPHETEPRTIEAGVWNRAALARLAADNHQAALSTLDFALTRLPNVHVLQNNRNAIISQWCQQAVQQFDYAAARGRALYGASTVAELSDSRRQLWRYCCELELQARLQADQLTAAGQLLAEAQSLDPANPRWQTWHRQLGASLAD